MCAPGRGQAGCWGEPGRWMVEPSGTALESASSGGGAMSGAAAKLEMFQEAAFLPTVSAGTRARPCWSGSG